MAATVATDCHSPHIEEVFFIFPSDFIYEPWQSVATVAGPNRLSTKNDPDPRRSMR